MNIKEALEKGNIVYRESWYEGDKEPYLYITTIGEDKSIWICTKLRGASRGWTPDIDDLTANDWKVYKQSKESEENEQRKDT